MEKSLKDLLGENRELYDKARRGIIREHKVRGALGTLIKGYEPPFIHSSRLYGAVGSIDFRAPFAESLRKGASPDKVLLAGLILAVPPVPRIEIRDGCLSMRPCGPGYDPKTDKKIRDYEKTSDLFGVLIDIEPTDRRAAFKWYGVLDGDLWGLSVKFPLHELDIGELKAEAKRWGQHGPPRSWDCSFHPGPELHSCQVTRWASGAPEYPNRFTLRWDPDSGADMDFPALVREKEAAA